MFIFKLSKSEEQGFNYPKYTIVLKNSSLYYPNTGSSFYYILTYNVYCIGATCKFPTFFVVPILFIDRSSKDDKFNLSKLGTDYIVNRLRMHYKKECKGSYPDNYVFMTEPRWPAKEYRTDRTPLKRSY